MPSPPIAMAVFVPMTDGSGVVVVAELHAGSSQWVTESPLPKLAMSGRPSAPIVTDAPTPPGGLSEESSPANDCVQSSSRQCATPRWELETRYTTIGNPSAPMVADVY